MQKLPEIFAYIIRYDRQRPSGPVVDLRAYTDWLTYRRTLSQQAAAYITAQRGGNGRSA